jgi:hypothetical protein
MRSWWSPPQLAVYFGLNADNWPFFLPVAMAVAIQVSILLLLLLLLAGSMLSNLL